ncbi:QRFP-like peptide receptor [Saccoglossus kowalevskii]|uniref:Orexin receptor type 2-like n=1 Tax=Saccoglossus kowalevskii TaxID=10224 RepID=A0ABM0GK59_SACKO|nr:PREDICTED: orexin receptor type 2-like [Saccoglossus kowalevskii]
MDCSSLETLQFVLAGMMPESDLIDPKLLSLNCSNNTTTNDTDAVFLDYSVDEIIDTFRQGMYTHRSPTTIALIILYLTAFVLGCVGNTLVIIAWFRNKHIRTIINCFLVNLAVCDLAVVLVCMPITLGNIVYQEWIYGEVLCKLTPCVQGMSVSSSVLILTAVSLNRFYAIHSPLKAKVLYTRRRVRILIIIIWIISLILMIPILIVNRLVTQEFFGVVKVTSCQEEWGSMYLKHAYNMSLFLIQFALPMLFMFVAYVMIFRALISTSAELGKNANPDKEAQYKSRRKVVRLLIVVVLLFAISWFPYHVATIWADYHPVGEVMKVFPFVQWLGLCSSSLNPICYCFLSKTYRKTFKASLQCQRQRRSSLKSGLAEQHGIAAFAFSLGEGSRRSRSRKRGTVSLVSPYDEDKHRKRYATMFTNGNYINNQREAVQFSKGEKSPGELMIRETVL